MRKPCGQTGIKVLLLDRHTQLFYRGHDLWTANPGEAFDFQCSGGLPDYQEKLALPHTELMVHFESQCQVSAWRPTSPAC